MKEKVHLLNRLNEIGGQIRIEYLIKKSHLLNQILHHKMDP